MMSQGAMKFGNYIPERGDIVWLDFSPQKGSEIKKTRPALTISPADYNKKTSLGLFMPITSIVKNYPFELFVSKDMVTGVILSDHIKSLDWKERNAKKITTLDSKTVQMALEKIKLLIG